MVLEPLVRPSEYFADHEPDLTVPVAIVLAVVVLTIVTGAVGVFVTADAAADAAPDSGDGVNPTGFAVAGGAIGIVLGLLWLGAVFLFYAGSFHGLTALFDGEGSFGATVAIVGWGFAPKVVDVLLDLLNQLFVAYRVTAAGMAPEEAGLGAIGTFGLGAISIVLLLWSAYIWFGGLRRVRNVDATGAGVAVGLPVFLALIWNGFWLLAGTLAASMV